MIFASSRFFRLDLANSLQSQARSQVYRRIGQGQCALESIQALCVLIHWKYSLDTTAWLDLGNAVHMAQQLRLDDTKNWVVDGSRETIVSRGGRVGSRGETAHLEPSQRMLSGLG